MAGFFIPVSRAPHPSVNFPVLIQITHPLHFFFLGGGKAPLSHPELTDSNCGYQKDTLIAIIAISLALCGYFYS